MKQSSITLDFDDPKNSLTKELKDDGNGAWNILHKSSSSRLPSDTTLFSSSLPVLSHEKYNGSSSTDNNSPVFNSTGPDVEEACEIGNLLPGDEDVLLAGIMDDFDFSKLPGTIEDMEECDVFGSGGGMELENESLDRLNMNISKMNLTDGIMGNGVLQYGIASNLGTVAGEHPYGEHPSRTLFVRNINSNVEDSELKSLFEQYGDIRTLYTACKHRGFVMISYYDIRAARTALRALQNKPLRRRKLDIHFSIPKDNPSDKDINQGTLVVFNLDPSVSNDDLRIIFGAYGEVKEIRETPHKKHHKFIEFYDVRAAEAALRSLNRSDIAGKRIKLEPSRPGGARRNLMLQMNQELEQDDTRAFWHLVGSPATSSSPGNWNHYNSPGDHSPLQSMSRSPVMNRVSGNHLQGLASILPSHSSNPVKISPIGHPSHGVSFESHSLPESNLSKYYGSSSLNPTSNDSVETLSGPQFLWGSPKPFNENMKPSPWTNSFSYSAHQSPLSSSFQQFQSHHHVGSSPSIAPLERRFGFFTDSSDVSLRNSGGFDNSFLVNMNHGMPIHKNVSENCSSGFQMMSSSRFSPVVLSNGPYSGLPTNKRVENSANLIDSKKHFQLDLDKIISGEDSRTTLMIKNIPNKYTSKMLLAAIDEKHKGTYDFLYLPIDFKNKCNVGYAFINILSPSHIISFYEAFNGKRWEKFNSEKVASLAYARIQGKSALVNHFQNSSLMNEDKRCRPILFPTDGEETADQELS